MKKINTYLFFLTNKYLIINFLIVSIFIILINLIELSRVISEAQLEYTEAKKLIQSFKIKNTLLMNINPLSTNNNSTFTT